MECELVKMGDILSLKLSLQLLALNVERAVAWLELAENTQIIDLVFMEVMDPSVEVLKDYEHSVERALEDAQGHIDLIQEQCPDFGKGIEP